MVTIMNGFEKMTLIHADTKQNPYTVSFLRLDNILYLANLASTSCRQKTDKHVDREMLTLWAEDNSYLKVIKN